MNEEESGVLLIKISEDQLLKKSTNMTESIFFIMNSEKLFSSILINSAQAGIMLERFIAINELCLSFTLSELAEHGLANPRKA